MERCLEMGKIRSGKINNKNVPNIEEAITDMESHGVKLAGREERSSPRTATFHPKDLCGVFIELIEE